MMKLGLKKMQGKLAALLALVLLLSVGLPGVGVLAEETNDNWTLRIYEIEDGEREPTDMVSYDTGVVFLEADCSFVLDVLIEHPKLKQGLPPDWTEDGKAEDYTFWSFGYSTGEFYFNYMLEKDPHTVDEFNKYDEEFFKLYDEEANRIFNSDGSLSSDLNPGFTEADKDKFFEKFEYEAFMQGIDMVKDGKTYSGWGDYEEIDFSGRRSVIRYEELNDWRTEGGKPFYFVQPVTSYEDGIYWSTVFVIKVLPEKPDGEIRVVGPTRSATNATKASEAVKQVRALVNGKELEGGVAPYIQDGRTMGPLRAVADAFGYDVAWDGETKTITLKDEHTTIVMKIGEREYEVNGKKDNFEDAVPSIKDGSTFLPMRGLADIVDAEVEWDAETSTASFTKK